MKTAFSSLSLALALVGCATEQSRALEHHVSWGGNFHEIAVALDAAEAKWAATGITNYSFRIRRGGAFGGSVYNAVYRPGSCGATHLKDVGLPASFSCEENSMPQLFAEIRNQVASRNSDISVSLDPKIGYVRSFSIEPHTDLTDQGWGAEISHFRVLK